MRNLKQVYEDIEAGYYHTELNNSSLQNFWHTRKFGRAISLSNVKGKRILDLGCAAGTFLSMLSGYKSATGLDISKKQTAFARRLLPGKKNKWITSDIKTARLPKNYFDYIFMMEVIEHLPPEDTQVIFKNIHTWLNPGGRLILTTPNYVSLWPIIETLWSKMNPIDYTEQHINRFTLSRMERELHEAGFSVKTSTFFILSPFLSPISLKLADAFMKLESRLFPNLGSLMLIEARK